MTGALSPLLGENGLFKSIGAIFHPLFELFGFVLAGIYSVIPNYAVSIIGLTVLIMLALTPVTVKSTKSMIAMQRLQPEMKKLQAKYKGPENREILNQEMMKLYKDNGTSPFGACLPSLLQMPFLIVLYSLIRGLSFGKLNKAGEVIKATPRYIPVNSKMYTALVHSKGQMHSWFGMDLSTSPWTALTHHRSNQFVLAIPYLVLIGMAIFLQYYQMKQMNSRNPQAAANAQMQTMQKFFPIIFGFIYLRVPAGAVIYMVVSSAMRIGTQDVMFRTGMVTPVGMEREKEREIGGNSKSNKTAALEESTDDKPAAKSPAASKNGNGNRPANGRRPTAAKRPANTKGSSNGKATSNGRADGNNGSSDSEQTPAPKPHPRSRSKKERKAR